MADDQRRCDACMHHSGIMAKLDALTTAINVAKTEMDRRLEGMNEFRAQLSQQANQFASKTEVNLLIDKIMTRLDYLEKSTYTHTGSTKWTDHIITVLIAMAVFIIGKLVVK